jgi:hypothetical protein
VVWLITLNVVNKPTMAARPSQAGCCTAVVVPETAALADASGTKSDTTEDTLIMTVPPMKTY